MERPDDTLHDEDFSEEGVDHGLADDDAVAVPDPDEREVGPSPEEEELEPIPDDPAHADPDA